MNDQAEYRRERILHFIRTYLISNKYPPTSRDISEQFGLSTSVFYHHVSVLRKRGVMIPAQNGRSRSYVPTGTQVLIPRNVAEMRVREITEPFVIVDVNGMQKQHYTAVVEQLEGRSVVLVGGEAMAGMMQELQSILDPIASVKIAYTLPGRKDWYRTITASIEWSGYSANDTALIARPGTRFVGLAVALGCGYFDPDWFRENKDE